jgi:hypothetical protein
MANTNAYVAYLDPIGSGPDETYDSRPVINLEDPFINDSVHQVSPAWVITFVTWNVRDTLRTKATASLNYQTTRYGNPIVVENDCVSVNAVFDKGNLTDSADIMLKVTDINYETVIAPGDFVFVNMLNWEEDARRVRNQARGTGAGGSQPINGALDGFKGVYKVQGVRKVLGVDPQSGKKAFFVKITAFAFTEFNNTIYFNQELLFSQETENLLLYVSNISNNWKIIQNLKGLVNIQDKIEVLIDSFLGTGIGDAGKMTKTGLLKSANTLFYMPALVGVLLNVPQATAAKDIYNFNMGIQQYSNNPNQTLAQGMNPINFASGDSRIWKPANASSKCQGDNVTRAEYWDQVQVWSIFNQLTNSPLNELFSCLRIAPNGSVMPTIVFRQIPFTNDDFSTQFGNNVPLQPPEVTRFTSIPRWKLNPSLVTSMDLGRDESLRINFVQYFGRSSTFGQAGVDVSFEIAQGNYLYDIDDVKRNGLRPKIISTPFDETLAKGKAAFQAVGWAKIVGDAVIGGHLRMQGTIECAGIVDPVAVGDNLEFDDVIYHIERVSHTCSIEPESGNKIFRTTFGLSMGISTNTSAKGVQYAEMAYGNAYANRAADAANSEILPGISESQDIVQRSPPNSSSLDVPHSLPDGVNDGFQQPNLNTSVQLTGVENQYPPAKKGGSS